MGTTFYNAKFYKNGKVDRKAECDNLINYTTDHVQQAVLRSSVIGTIYYAAVERIEDGKRMVWAAVIKTYGQDRSDPYYNFGYKDMDETMIPCYYDCPKGILDLLTPTDNENANIWREKCRNKPKSKLAGLKIGDKVILHTWDGKTRILTKHAPAFQFKTWFWFDEENYKYISKKCVTDNNTEIITA